MGSTPKLSGRGKAPGPKALSGGGWKTPMVGPGDLPKRVSRERTVIVGDETYGERGGAVSTFGGGVRKVSTVGEGLGRESQVGSYITEPWGVLSGVAESEGKPVAPAELLERMERVSYWLAAPRREMVEGAMVAPVVLIVLSDAVS